MISAEWMVILLNLVIVAVAYVSIYPKVAKDNLTKISVCDVALSMFALAVVGMKFWGSDFRFDMVFAQVNWFWFTLLSYFIIEIPFAIWYIRKFGVKLQ